MTARIPSAESRETALINETRSQFSTLSRAVLAGDPAATKRIADALGEYVADTHAAGELARGLLTSQGAGLKVVTELIWAEAGELAEVEVQRMERARTEDAADESASLRLWNSYFAWSVA